MAPFSYPQLDEARERAKQQLSQLILNRNVELSHLARHHAYSSALNARRIWTSRLYTAILSYTQAANMTVVARVLELPREIRDTIYLHLWESDGQQEFQRHLLYWWELFDQPWVIRGIDTSESLWEAGATDLKPPHFVDKAFVGADFAREVLVRLQDAVGKDLRPCEGNPITEFSLIDASMEAFARKDAFGVGKTMEELVRNLDLRINFQCDVLDEEDEDNRVHEEDNSANKEADKHEETQCHKSSELARQETLAELEDGVTALLGIPYSNRVTIHDGQTKRLSSRPRIITLVVRQECSINVSNSLVPILRLVARARQGLSETGFKVKILYHSDEIGLKTFFDEDVWTWSVKDWKDNMKEKNTCRVDPEEWDLAKQAEVWEQIRNVLFNVEADGE